jgi:hypothetical protein
VQYPVATISEAGCRPHAPQVADAWIQAKLGDTARLDDIVDCLALRYRSIHQEDDAVIFAFDGPNGRCVDLISRPDANTVRTECQNRKGSP